MHNGQCIISLCAALQNKLYSWVIYILIELNTADYGWMFALPGSILNVRVLNVLLYATLCSTALALISCEMNQDWDFCIPVPSGWKNLTVGTVSGFVTIIFISQLITRWWQIRVLLQGVFGKGNSM
jgi:hypothetical protein